jgi:hypothetical protein
VAIEGDRARTIFAMMVARMWRDPQYLAEFLSNPKATLANEGVQLPPEVNVQVVRDGPGVKYLSLTPDINLSQDADKFIAIMSKLLPIPHGTELRLVQSTENTKYVVLPTPPPGVDPASTPETQLLALTVDSGVEATYHDTSQTTEAETTEVTVTETSEVQDAETSTTVVAEAELVAT